MRKTNPGTLTEDDSTLRSPSRQKNIWNDTRQIVSVPSGGGRGILRERVTAHSPVLLSVLVKFTAFVFKTGRGLHYLFCSGSVNKIHSLRKNIMRFSPRGRTQTQAPGKAGVQADGSRTHCHMSQCPRPRSIYRQSRTLSRERPGPRPQRPLLRSSTLQLRPQALQKTFTP